MTFRKKAPVLVLVRVSPVVGGGLGGPCPLARAAAGGSCGALGPGRCELRPREPCTPPPGRSRGGETLTGPLPLAAPVLSHINRLYRVWLADLYFVSVLCSADCAVGTVNCMFRPGRLGRRGRLFPKQALVLVVRASVHQAAAVPPSVLPIYFRKKLLTIKMVI